MIMRNEEEVKPTQLEIMGKYLKLAQIAWRKQNFQGALLHCNAALNREIEDRESPILLQLQGLQKLIEDKLIKIKLKDKENLCQLGLLKGSPSINSSQNSNSREKSPLAEKNIEYKK